MRRPILLALATVAISTSTLVAQGPSCAARGAKLPAAGSWAEYKTTEGNMRMAYLAKETAGERLELSMTGQRGTGSWQPPRHRCPRSSPGSEWSGRCRRER